jgi:preprotein translocase subunit SecF
MGVLLGTYSSIFLAGPLVFDWNEGLSLTKKNKKA